MLILLSFVLGLFTWTFLEYAIHNWAGHLPKGRGIISKEHLTHHTRVDYFTSLAKKIVMAFFVIGGLSYLSSFLSVPIAWGVAFSSGIGGGWMFYEVLHRRLHTHGPGGVYMRWATRHHFYHHFNAPKMNHGVTTPLWDHVFGTYRRADMVNVPKRHAPKLPWLSAEGVDAHFRVV